MPQFVIVGLDPANHPVISRNATISLVAHPLEWVLESSPRMTMGGTVDLEDDESWDCASMAIVMNVQNGNTKRDGTPPSVIVGIRQGK